MTSLQASQILYQFLTQPSLNLAQIKKPVASAVVFGCNDINVARHAAKAWQLGLCSRLVFSGGYGRLSKNEFSQTEASLFAEEAISLGVPKTSIICDHEASNTGQNIANSLALLQQLPEDQQALLLICKPIMCQRVLATFSKQSLRAAAVSCPAATSNGPLDQEQFNHHCDMMVGEIERLQHYPDQGFIKPVTIPAQTLAAFETLKTLGYTEQTII